MFFDPVPLGKDLPFHLFSVKKINIQMSDVQSTLISTFCKHGSKSEKNKSTRLNQRCRAWKAQDFYWVFLGVFFAFVFHQEPAVLRPSSSTTENLPKENGLLYPKGSRQKINWGPAPCCPLAWSLFWSQTTQKASEGGSYGPKSRSMNTGTCTESTIPPRGNDSALRTETRYYFIPK